MDRDDGITLAALRNNEGWAIQLIGDRIKPLIKNNIFSFQDWEDAHQQSLLEIIDAVTKTAEIRNLWGFVKRIAITTVIDYNRRHSIRSARVVSVEDRPGAGDDPGDEVPDRKMSHDIAYESRDLFLYIFQRLGRSCQQLLHMVYIEEVTYSEAAAKLSITEGNLRVRLHRCKERAIALRTQYRAG